MAHSITLTAADAEGFAAIRLILGQLGAYGGAAVWHDGARHTDDDDPPRLADELPGWLLRQPQQADRE